MKKKLCIIYGKTESRFALDNFYQHSQKLHEPTCVLKKINPVIIGHSLRMYITV